MPKEISVQTLEAQSKQMALNGATRLEVVRILMEICKDDEDNNTALINWLLSSTLRGEE